MNYGLKMDIRDTLAKMVGKIKQRNYAANTDNHLLTEEEMKQASGDRFCVEYVSYIRGSILLPPLLRLE